MTDSHLKQRQVGRAAVCITELGFGAGCLGGLFAPMDYQSSCATLQTALDVGVRFFDTAPHYGRGLSERRVGDALRGCKDIVVSTKVGRLMIPDRSIQDDAELDGFYSNMPFRASYDYTYDGVLRSHEASLHRLGLAQIDILFVHDIGRLVHGESHTEYWRQLTLGGGFKALEELRSQGAIAAFGIGVNEVEVCLDALRAAPLDVILLAGRYTLLEQAALDALFPMCAANAVSVVIGGPYNSGILVSGTRTNGQPRYNYRAAPPDVVDRVARMERIAADNAIPLAAAALQFPLAHPCVASVIPGQGRPEEVRAALSYLRHPIPSDFWQELRAEGLIRADAPVRATEN